MSIENLSYKISEVKSVYECMYNVVPTSYSLTAFNLKCFKLIIEE